MTIYDCAVIGAGAMGSGALARMAQRGARVIGFERFPIAHDRGSSHGRTRMTRLAYFEHPDYVPLLRRTFELWGELDDAVPETLYEASGILEAGLADGELVNGILDSVREHDLHVDELSTSEMKRRFPGFELPEGTRALFEPTGGTLHVEACVRALVAQARECGAEVLEETPIDNWEAEGAGFTLRSGARTWRTKRLILTQGAWASGWFEDLGVPLTVLRKNQLWFRTRDERYTTKNGFVPFCIETAGGVFYGFPQVDEGGIKVAEHSQGEVVTDPDAVDRELRAADLESVRKFTRACMPGVTGECLSHAVCFYTKSPDEHFIVDRHPAHAGVYFAAGLSGHGFKFAPVLGEALADLALDGGTDLPIDFLSLKRFGGLAPEGG